MKNCDHFLYLTMALGGLLFLMPQSASAYIDATTGSYVIQLVFGAFLTGLFWIKSLLCRFKNRHHIDYSEIGAELKATGS